MYKKKLINLLLMSLLPMSGALIAEQSSESQPTAEPAAVVDEAETAAKMPAPAGASSEASEAAESAPDDGQMSMEERWKEREKRYEELKKRAEETGVMLPDTPPWRDRQAMMEANPEMQKRMEHMRKMQAMTPEERETFREERYQEMRERAAEIGMMMPEVPPWKNRQTMMQEQWANHLEVIKGMTDEERAACQAMHRRHMRQMMGQGPNRQMMQGQGMQSPQMPAYEGYGPGYGYGPFPYGPQGNY
jgi:hypothetical protein